MGNKRGAPSKLLDRRLSDELTLTDRMKPKNGGGRILWVKLWTEDLQDIGVENLIALQGFEGYGRYIRLIQCLAANKHHLLPLKSDAEYLAIAKRLGFPITETGSKKLDSFLDTLRGLGLLEPCGEGLECRESIDVVQSAAVSRGQKSDAGGRGAQARHGNTDEE